MNTKPYERVLKKPVCTWLSTLDYDRLHAIADANGVTLAAYLRAIIVDTIADETARSAILAPLRSEVARV